MRAESVFAGAAERRMTRNVPTAAVATTAAAAIIIQPRRPPPNAAVVAVSESPEI